MSDFREQWKEKSLRNIGEKGNQIVIFKQTGWNIFIFIVSRNHTNRAGIYFLSLSPSMLAAVWLWITEHLGWEGPLGSHQAQPIPITWPALNSDKDAKGLISLVHWKLPSRGISESSWIPLPASNHPHGENCFPDLQSGVLLLQLVCFPHTSPHGTDSTHLPPQASVWCPGLGPPFVPPSCPSPDWGEGMGPGCQNAPCWLEMKEVPCSKLTSLQEANLLNSHKHAAKVFKLFFRA